MNHQLAVNTRATERYMLGELDDESRSAFEEHYFSCRVCAGDVQTVAQFVDNAKAVMALRDERPWQHRSAWFPWTGAQLLVPAAMAVCLAIGYSLPRFAGQGRANDGLIASVAVPAGSRGTQAVGQTISLDKDASMFLVRLEIADDVIASRLHWRVKTASGEQLRFQTMRENQAVLPLRAADFPAGRYELVLSAGSPEPQIIDRYPFTIMQR